MEDLKGSAKVPAKATPIEQAIKKYNVTDAAVAKLKKKCMAIKVLDHGDKKGYAFAHDARMEVKSIRVQFEKTRVALNKDALEFRTAVNGEAKRLTDLVTPLEEYLLTQEKIVDDEKERVKTEKVEKLKQRMRTRVDLLRVHGMVYDGVDNYSFLHFGITNMEVNGHSDDVFDMFVKNLKSAYDAEQERLAKVEADEIKAQEEKEADDARIKKEQDDEAARLLAQKTEQDEKEAKIKADQDKIIADQKLIDDARKKAESDKIEADRVTNANLAAEKKARDDADARDKQDRKDYEAKEKQAEKDEELRKALLPDNEKLSSLADLLESCHQPALTHKHSHDRLDKAWKLVLEACVILRDDKTNGKTK